MINLSDALIMDMLRRGHCVILVPESYYQDGKDEEEEKEGRLSLSVTPYPYPG